VTTRMTNQRPSRGDRSRMYVRRQCEATGVVKTGGAPRRQRCKATTQRVPGPEVVLVRRSLAPARGPTRSGSCTRRFPRFPIRFLNPPDPLHSRSRFRPAAEELAFTVATASPTGAGVQPDSTSAACRPPRALSFFLPPSHTTSSSRDRQVPRAAALWARWLRDSLRTAPGPMPRLQMATSHSICKGFADLPQQARGHMWRNTADRGVGRVLGVTQILHHQLMASVRAPPTEARPRRSPAQRNRSSQRNLPSHVARSLGGSCT